MKRKRSADGITAKTASKRKKFAEKVEIAEAVEPSEEEKSQLLEHARQSEDSITSEPTKEDFDSVVIEKMNLREKLGELIESSSQHRFGPPRTVSEFAFISDSDINNHDTLVTSLTAEVNSAASSERQADPLGSGVPRPLSNFQATRWTPYVMKWRSWVQEHTGTLSRFDDAEFASLRTEYNNLRQEWTQLGQQTHTPAASPGGDSGIDTAVSGAVDIVKAVGLLAGLYFAFSLLKGKR